MKCPSCGFENMKGSTTCARCYGILVWEGPRGREHFRPPRAERRLTSRHTVNRINQGIVSYFTVLGRIPDKNWWAMLASLVPGLGQTRRQRIVLGVVFFVLWVAAVFGAVSLRNDSAVTTILPLCLMLFAYLLHCFAVVDAASPVDFCRRRGELKAFLISVALFFGVWYCIAWWVFF